ncbi:MAG: LPS export ABC transporter ATP-binding protein [Candidatus Firestonebacteria bacterium]|nr:LPS export ABC transporter ATP-binding protein [Candidatus Firestonebacteria bacterium]
MTRVAPTRPVSGPQVLATENLIKIYHHKQVVNRVNVEVKRGEIVGLLGPNGAGKTTTFYMVVGFIKPDGGRIILGGPEGKQDITGLPMYQRARLGISYLSQEPSIFRKMTVEENIVAILETLKLGREEQARRLDQLLNELGIAHLRRQKAYTLSGGERRRLEITRALVINPAFILLDEPFVGVDPIAVLDIQNVIRQLRRRGIGIMITDHNVRETLSITDRAYILYEGKILLAGTAKKLAASKKAKEIYLGEKFTL